VNAALDEHLGRLSWHGFKTVGTHHAGTIQKRVDAEEAVACFGLLEPKVSEVRELLRLAADGVHSQSACRDAKPELRSDGPKIGSTQKDKELKSTLQELIRRKDTEPGEPIGIGHTFRHLDLAPVKEFGIVTDRSGVTTSEIKHADGLLCGPADMEELQAIGVVELAKVRCIFLEANLAMVVILEAVKELVQRLARGSVWLGGEFCRHRLKAGEILHRKGIKVSR